MIQRKAFLILDNILQKNLWKASLMKNINKLEHGGKRILKIRRNFQKLYRALKLIAQRILNTFHIQLTKKKTPNLIMDGVKLGDVYKCNFPRLLTDKHSSIILRLYTINLDPLKYSVFSIKNVTTTRSLMRKWKRNGLCLMNYILVGQNLSSPT